MTELYRELMRRGDLIKQRESLEQFQKVELSRLNKELGNYGRSIGVTDRERYIVRKLCCKR